MNTLSALTAIASIRPYMDVQDALAIARVVSDGDDAWYKTHEGRVNFARQDTEVQDAISRDLKIKAIKRVRDAVVAAGGQQPDSGLKAAKDVIDEIAPPAPLY